MSESENELPDAWSWTTVEEVIAEARYGSSAKTGSDDGVPVLRMGNLVGGSIDWSDLKYLPRDHSEFPDLFLEDGDILFNRTNSPELVGKTAVYRHGPHPCSFASYLIRLRTLRVCHPNFLAWYINSHHGRLWVRSVVTQQVGQANVNGTKLKALRFPLAPRPEQDRIVAAIDSCFSRLDDATATLKRVQRNLERYRASVLKAAVEGRLVPTDAELAKKESRSYEPASALLKRILVERRRKWEEAELAKLKAKGKPATGDRWKAKYVEPIAPETEGLPALPEGWTWVSIEQVSILVTDGDHNPPPRVPVGIPHLTAKHVKRWSVSLNGCTYVSPEGFAQTQQRYAPLAGDVLITCVGTVGEAAVVPPDLVFSADRNLAGIRVDESAIVPRYLVYALTEPRARQRLRAVSGATAQPHVYLRDLRATAVPLPPVPEQHRIVSEIEHVTSLIRDIEGSIETASLRRARLRQSILKWAFEGWLVDQDPTDEPATALLERIRAERGSTNGHPKKPARAHRAKASNS